MINGIKYLWGYKYDNLLLSLCFGFGMNFIFGYWMVKCMWVKVVVLYNCIGIDWKKDLKKDVMCM